MWTRGVMAMLTVILMVMMVASSQADYTNDNINTTCGHRVLIDLPQTPSEQEFYVSLTLDQSQVNDSETSGLNCSWILPAHNASEYNLMWLMSYRVPGLSCENKTLLFSVFEEDPSNMTAQLHPLVLQCDGTGYGYSNVISRLGFTMVVMLNATQALPDKFHLMTVIPRVWDDALCPMKSPRLLTALPVYDEYRAQTISLPDFLIRVPDNASCKWKFRSDDGGLVRLKARTFGHSFNDKQVCPDGDELVFSESEDDSNAVVVPYCSRPGIEEYYTSLTGEAFLTLKTDSEGGASYNALVYYWSEPACPALPYYITTDYEGTERVIKMVSYNSSGAGIETECRWNIAVYSSYRIIQLTKLDKRDFNANGCNETVDYVMVDDQRVSLCDHDEVFPIWSTGQSMNVTLHTTTTAMARSAVLYVRAVRIGQCQGVVQTQDISSEYGYAFIQAMTQNDTGEGTTCQWLFTGKSVDKVLQLRIPLTASSSSSGAVACTFPNFSVYSGDTANNTHLINATCPSTNSEFAFYTSSRREMFIVYHRAIGAATPQLTMQVRQVYFATGGGAARSTCAEKWLRVVLVSVAATLMNRLH